MFAGATLTVKDDRQDYGEDRFMTIGFLDAVMVVLVWTRARRRIPDRQHEGKPMNGNERFTPQDFDPETAPDLSAGEWPAKFARARVRRGRPPLATPKVSTTIRLSPDVLAHFKAGGRGWQTRINAALREWIRTYTKALELNPTDAAAYNNRGTAKDDLGQPEAAIADYDRAIAKDENMSQDVAEIEMKVIPKDEWDEKVAVVRQKGERFAREMRLQGKRFKAAILGPREFPPGADVAMQAVVIQRDWKAAAKLEMVEDANNFLTKSTSD